MTTSRTVRARRGLRSVLLVALVAGTAACGSSKPEEAVRPLVDLEGVDLSVGDYDDPSLHARLERLAEEVGPIAAQAGGWGKLTTDLVNPEIQDIVFTGADRATLNFGYGTEATSMLARDDEAIFVMAGDSGSCWAIRFRGPTNTPQVRKGVKFAPNCYANELADLPEESWTTKWPPPAEPTGGSVGAPPPGPTGRNGAGVADDPQDGDDVTDTTTGN
jgi:hypothetical protein